jgi:hypothetical protein
MCRRRNEIKQGRSYTLERVLQRENRKKRSKQLGRGEGGWEKKIQRQGGKCREEETDGIDRRKSMGSIERDQTRRRRRGMDLYIQQVGNNDTLRNSERRSMGKSRRIQNRKESRVGPSRTSFEEAKGRERIEKERDGG